MQVLRLLRCLVVVLLFSASLFAQQLDTHRLRVAPVFEPLDSGYEARTSSIDVRAENNVLKLTNRILNREESLTWIDASGQVGGKDATGGVTNYAIGADPKTWRMGVPHFSRVRSTGLYPGIDVEYYFSEGRLEFDLILAAGANPKLPRYKLAEGATLSVTADGELAVHSPDGDYTHRAPQAYQGEGDAKLSVGCSYILYPDETVGFELDSYDSSRPLIIDPVIDFMTYLGGNNQDFMLALDVDSFGNVVFGGMTNSSNFPGVPASSSRTSVFVAKMNSTGTALLFTTILGTSTLMPDQGFIPIRDLEVDALGDIYIAGARTLLDFPVTPGAYQSSGSGFVTKLSPTGEIQYSTFIDGPGLYSLAPVAIHARGGVAYVAGNTLGFGFTGTADAYQKQAGFADIFALALNTDGSGLLYATAFGGTQVEELRDMAIDQGGNVILVGTSASNTLPVTNTEVPAPTFSQSNGFVARLNSLGSQLLNFGWLGPTIPTGVVVSPDGSFIVAGAGTLPVGLASLQQRPFVGPLPPGQPSGYILKRSPSDQTLWVTGVNANYSFAGPSLAIDSDGNLYWPDYWPEDFGYDSGGAFHTEPLLPPSGVSMAAGPSPGINKLSADGKKLLYSSRIPVVPLQSNRYNRLHLAAGMNGTLLVGGTTPAVNWPTTPGVIQGSRDPAPAGPPYPSNSDDGIFFKLNLQDFSNGNFFLTRRTQSRNITELKWRLGEPLPAPVPVPIYLSGSSIVEAIPSNGLAAVVQQDPPSVALNIDMSSLSAEGIHEKSLTLRLQGVPGSELTLPVDVTILPRIVFEIEQTEVEIHYRLGQPRVPLYIPITTNLADQGILVNVQSSDPTWLGGFVNPVSRLGISVGAMPVGAYQGTILLAPSGSSIRRAIGVRYVVHPAPALDLPVKAVSVNVIKGQPVETVKIPILSVPSNVPYTISSSPLPMGLSITRGGSVTPASVDVKVNSNVIAPGNYQFSIYVFAQGATSVLNETKLSVNVDQGPVAPDPRFTVEPAVCSTGNLGVLKFHWAAPGFGDVQIRVGSPDGVPMTGPLPPSGSTMSGAWVTQDMKFYLIAVSSGEVISSITANVLCGVLTQGPFTCTSLDIARTSLSWNAPGWSDLSIRVGAIDGPLMAGSLGSYGTTETGPWARDGMEFFLLTPSGDLIASYKIFIPLNPCNSASLTSSAVTCIGNLAKATLSWSASNFADMRILVGDFPDGALFAGIGGSFGSVGTGPWVTNGMKFTLATPHGPLVTTRVVTNCQ